ncbi:hypothetical protein AM202_05814 [Actinobacillus minor 202]|uniref:Uncharacterized protein n=2 Tax=Actinobacillus TaxID=713 RepID=A0A2U8FHC5_9PAST|nr:MULTISPECIES: hypothetical protein [Actinobacillus]AWI50327.1 hypothetical protein DDU33_01895 [Actinobacillus porcitonsillarum]EEV24449.1 hypothetical protein AM202_05814 [Actinobacillus minor 202]
MLPFKPYRHRKNNDYLKEYNIINSTVGILAITAIITGILTNAFILKYLKEIDSSELFIESISNNFSAIFIPISIVIFYSLFLMNSLPIRSFFAVKRNNNYSKNRLYIEIICLMEIIFIPLISIVLIKGGWELLIITLPIISTYFFLLHSIRQSIEFFPYFCFTISIFLISPIIIIIFDGDINNLTIEKMAFLYFIFMGFSFFLNNTYLLNIKKHKRAPVRFYLLSSVTIIFAVSTSPFEIFKIDIVRNSLRSIGIIDNNSKTYFIEKTFIQKSLKNTHSLTNTKPTNTEQYKAYCGKIYWKSNTEVVFKQMNDNEYIRIPKDKVYEFQGKHILCEIDFLITK